MDAAIEVLGITGSIYLAIALGYVVTRRGLFTRADMQVFGRFTIHLALPALLFNALSRQSVAAIMNWQYLMAYAAGCLGMLALGMVWHRKVQGQSTSYSAILTMGMTCSNSGFVGYPIVLLTLGGAVAGVALALNMIVENLLIIPLLVGLSAVEGGSGSGWRTVVTTLKGVARNPMIWGISLGFAAALAGFQLPKPLARTVDLFAAASSALSLFVIGGSLVGLQHQGMKKTVLQIALGKLLVHPLIMLAVLLWVFPLADASLRTALLLTCAMPMMGIYTVLAQRVGREAVSAAALVVTTVLSFFSLTALLWFLKAFPL